MPVSQKQLKELIHYSPETGVFTWLKKRKSVTVGAEAGAINGQGYKHISVDNELYLAHRLAFLYMEGSLPPDIVDHVNRKKIDNRWCNLRHATHKTNSENMVRNTSFVGVFWHKARKRWCACSSVQQKHLGYFKTHLAACYARWAYDMGEAL